MLLPFATPLIAGRLVRRYKRFLADVDLDDGRRVTAHCANTGSMLGCATPGSRALLSESRRPGRKLPFTLEVVAAGRTYVGVNPIRANALAALAVARGKLPALAGYTGLRREATLGPGHRVDLLLEGPRRPPCAVEVKSATLADGRTARFPDAVTARGLRHVEALARWAEAGRRAVVLFVVQRADCRRFAPAWEIDPAFSAALGRAAARGVEVLAYGARVGRRGITLRGALPVDLRPPDRPPAGAP